jgi:hypothetical protein
VCSAKIPQQQSEFKRSFGLPEMKAIVEQMTLEVCGLCSKTQMARPVMRK